MQTSPLSFIEVARAGKFGVWTGYKRMTPSTLAMERRRLVSGLAVDAPHGAHKLHFVCNLAFDVAL